MDWKKRGIVGLSVILLVFIGVILYRGQADVQRTSSKMSHEMEVVAVVPATGGAQSQQITAASGGVLAELDDPEETDKTDSPKKETDEEAKKITAAKKAAKDTNKGSEKNKSGKKKSEKKGIAPNSPKAVSDKKNRDGKKEDSSEPSQGAAAPTPTVQPQKSEDPERENQVSLQIQCTAILRRRDLWKDGLEEVVPQNGIFFHGMCAVREGDSVYDILKRVTDEQHIVLDSQYTPLYGSYYVRGIGNLYEFDCGPESGWRYRVNGEIASIGCSSYKVKSGDTIVFFYDYQYGE